MSPQIWLLIIDSSLKHIILLLSQNLYSTKTDFLLLKANKMQIFIGFYKALTAIGNSFNQYWRINIRRWFCSFFVYYLIMYPLSLRSAFNKSWGRFLGLIQTSQGLCIKSWCFSHSTCHWHWLKQLSQKEHMKWHLNRNGDKNTTNFSALCQWRWR